MGRLKDLLIDGIGRRSNNLGWRMDAEPFDLAPYSTVCLLHLDGKVGDAIMISSLLEAIALSAPHVSITVASQRSMMPYWRSHPRIDETIELPSRSQKFARRTQKFIGLGRQFAGKFDIVVCFEPMITLDSFLLIRLLRPRIAVGFTKDMYRLFDYSLMDYTFGPEKRHISKRVEGLLRLFRLDYDYSALPRHVPIGRDGDGIAAPAKAADPLLTKVFLNVYAASSERNLSPATVQAILSLILQDAGVFAYVSVPAISYLDPIKAWLDGNGHRLKLVTPCDGLDRLCALLNEMNCVVTPDTGVAHIASALDLPTLTIFRDRTYNPIVWRPLGERSDIIVSQSGSDINDLDGNELALAVKRLLINGQARGVLVATQSTVSIETSGGDIC